MTFEVKYTARFKKDLKNAKKQGKKLEKLFAVVEKLASGEKLAPKFCDHALTGNYSDCRECHIEPDWLLIYQIYEDIIVLSLQRLGSHDDLFK